MRHRRNLIAFASLAVLAAGLLSGCAGAGVRFDAGPASPSQTTPAEALEPMAVEQKRSAIATSFPLEVPVPDGEVVRGEAQGQSAWDYEVVVNRPLSAVESWYTGAYTGRLWELAGREQTAAGVSLTFRKGAAESRVTLSERGGRTTASVILGVGAPVLQTQ